MNKSILMMGITLMSFILITSCSDKSVDDASSTDSEQVTEGTEDNALIEEISNTDGTYDVNTQAQPGTQSSPSTSGGKLNPAHGEPGHDCAVPVGEPLPANGSAPAAAPQNIQVQSGGQQQISVPAPTTISTQTAAPTKTAPGMNPPHGEPGHDCAVPVGEPLKK